MGKSNEIDKQKMMAFVHRDTMAAAITVILMNMLDDNQLVEMVHAIGDMEKLANERLLPIVDRLRAYLQQEQDEHKTPFHDSFLAIACVYAQILKDWAAKARFSSGELMGNGLHVKMGSREELIQHMKELDNEEGIEEDPALSFMRDSPSKMVN